MKQYHTLLIAAALMWSCSDFLDLEPTDSVTADALFSSEEGIEAYLANLYSNLPIEDFNSTPGQGLSYNPGDANNGGFFPIVMTDDGIGSEQQNITAAGGGDFPWWEDGYKFNKDVNLFFSYLKQVTSLDQATKDELYGEAYFMRAYTYYALAKRYGGVPIITKISDVSDPDALNVPRSTEKETWDYVLAACDSAAELLGDGDGLKRRATKWTALALKSRAALHAASVAKYWDKAPLSGNAVTAGLVGGMSQEDAIDYYNACIEASEEIIKSNAFSLYRPNPSDPEEAAENYRLMFEDPNNAMEEVILLKGFTKTGTDYGSNQDNWGNPAQTAGAWPHPGRFNPSLDLIDTYENYSNPGKSSPVVTTTDGITANYNGYDQTRNYLAFDDPTDIFAGKDARMHGTVIIPGSAWKDTKIIIQGGYIKPDGTAVIESGESIEVDGKIYYTYGAAGPTLYSGFDTYGGNMTRTGFGFRKFLDSGYVPRLGWNFSTTDWIDFRYAEVFLNYAEAVVESGNGDQDLAAKAVNDLRKRAAHTVDIPLTLENVLRERRVELVYENKRYWDLIRRREYHEKFDNTKRTALVPVFDLRTMKYIFARQYVSRTDGKTFLTQWYYKSIPGIASNGLIQNPQY